MPESSLLGVDWPQFNLDAWRRLPIVVREQAVGVLRSTISSKDQEKIREVADGNPDWSSDYHFQWGMEIRNRLRASGLKDEVLPPSIVVATEGDQNWDDYYVACVEVAVRTGIWHQLSESERC